MNLAGLLALLRRQWILVGVIMLVSATSAFLTWEGATPSYRSSATLSVLPPRVNVEGVPRNPYLDIASASNADIAQRLSIQVNGAEWRDRLTEQGFSPDYLIDHGDATSPILRITIETSSPELSEATLVAVSAAVEEELATQQERFDVSPRSRFTIDTLDRSPGAIRLFGNRTRLTGAILVLGAIAAVIMAQALENYQRRRRIERTAAPVRAAPSSQRGASKIQSNGNRGQASPWVPRPQVEQPVAPAVTEQQPRSPILNQAPSPAPAQQTTNKPPPGWAQPESGAPPTRKRA